LMMNPVPWLQMTNMISYQGLVRTFPNFATVPLIVFSRIAGGSFLLSIRKDWHRECEYRNTITE
ncbi:hypothetical protein, partial [Citrobacter freundii]|uniref:hypothetical protein n=1 Tax=Citrobacter freundii TaxID=546 RepID=UPI0039B423C9